MAENQGTPVPGMAPETVQLLQRYGWPGNVRELANAIERAVILCRGNVLLPSAFEDQLREPGGPVTLAPTAVSIGAEPRTPSAAEPLPFDLDEIERRAIARALEATGGNRTRAAKLLGISERTLRNKLNSPNTNAATGT
jgi:DNA-binding NtrC family response regulator